MNGKLKLNLFIKILLVFGLLIKANEFFNLFGLFGNLSLFFWKGFPKFGTLLDLLLQVLFKLDSLSS